MVHTTCKQKPRSYSNADNSAFPGGSRGVKLKRFSHFLFLFYLFIVMLHYLVCLHLAVVNLICFLVFSCSFRLTSSPIMISMIGSYKMKTFAMFQNG